MFRFVRTDVRPHMFAPRGRMMPKILSDFRLCSLTADETEKRPSLATNELGNNKVGVSGLG